MIYIVQMARRIGVLFATIFLALNVLAENSKVSYAPVPDWVQEAGWALPDAASSADNKAGTRSLLFENQYRPASHEEFVRVVELMQNDSGVQDSGSLQVVFDAEFQELCLHRVVIHRGGQIIDRLNPSKVRVIQQEPGLYDDVIIGEQTAVLFVEDLRVGDTLEYAYTLRGANPVLAGHFSCQFNIQSGIPIDRKRFRVVWEQSTPLQQRRHLTDAQPVVKPSGRGTEYTWDFTHQAAIRYEDYQPASYEPYPYVEVSDFADWRRVVAWALPLYDFNPTNVPDALMEMIGQWQSASSDEEKARLALEFVQDNLRYTGVELGPDSYRPSDPVETFQKRFGDCKGKVALLRFLLAKMGITSYPALVNSAAHESIEHRLPSPFVFNHVILQIQLDGKTIWVDPTLAHQGGSLARRYLPPYGKALLVRPNESALTDVPRTAPENAWQQKATSTFVIGSYDHPACFTVRTVYHGASADVMREQISTAPANDLEKDYLDYYSRLYPGIASNQPVKITDNRSANLLVIEESYLVSNLWSHAKPDAFREASFYADNLYHALTDPGARLRKTPLALSYPMLREQEVIVHLPDQNWKIPALETNIENETFSFRYHRELRGSTAAFHYECRTKLAAVPVEQVPAYIADRDRVEDLLSDTLQRPGSTSENGINWLMAVIAMFGTGSTAFAGVWFWRRLNTTTGTFMPVEAEAKQLSGLGGWLILVAFGLCLSLVLRVVLLGQSWQSYFSIQVWQIVAMPHGSGYHPLYGPLLIFELLGNIFLLGLNLLTLCLFFGKRRAFPKVFITLALGNAAFLFADHLAAGMIPSLNSASSHTKGGTEIFRAAFYAVIWVSYMLKSQRVKATFVK